MDTAPWIEYWPAADLILLWTLILFSDTTVKETTPPLGTSEKDGDVFQEVPVSLRFEMLRPDEVFMIAPAPVENPWFGT